MFWLSSLLYWMSPSKMPSVLWMFCLFSSLCCQKVLVRAHMGVQSLQNSAQSILTCGFFCLGLYMSSSQRPQIIYCLSSFFFPRSGPIKKKRLEIFIPCSFSSLSRPKCWRAFSLTLSLSVRANLLFCLSISAHKNVMALLSLQITKNLTACRSCLSGSIKSLLRSGQYSVFSVSLLYKYSVSPLSIATKAKLMAVLRVQNSRCWATYCCFFFVAWPKLNHTPRMFCLAVPSIFIFCPTRNYGLNLWLCCALQNTASSPSWRSAAFLLSEYTKTTGEEIDGLLFALLFCQYSVKTNDSYPHRCVELFKIQNRVISIACGMCLASLKNWALRPMFCSFSSLKLYIWRRYGCVRLLKNPSWRLHAGLCFFCLDIPKLRL